MADLQKRIFLNLAGAIVLSFGACCADHQGDIGSTNIAVLSVARWETCETSLQPSFSLTADQALALAIPDTNQLQSASLSSLSGELSAQLSAAAGKPLPTTQPVRDIGSLLGTSILDPSKLGLDPMLRYWAATALYEEVQILNRYVQDADVEGEYYPFLVRMQITLMPKRPDLSYDAYTSVSVFNDDFADYPPVRRFTRRENIQQLVSELTSSDARSLRYELINSINAHGSPPTSRPVPDSSTMPSDWNNLMYDAVPIDAVEDGLAAAAINGGYRTSDSDKVEAAIAYARDRSPRFVAFRGFNPSDYVVSKELRYHFAKDSPDLSKASALLDDDLRQFLGDPAKAPTNSTSTTQPGDPSIFQSVCSLDIDASVMNKPEYVSVDDFEISLNEAASTLNDLKPAEWKQRVNELIGYQADYRSNYRPYVVSPPPKNPVVVPLLVTDDLQAAIQSQSVEQVRQLAISLAAMAGQANIQGGLNALDDQLRKSLGRSLNSTFTLARGPADNTIRARFGASQQAGSTFSMIPAAHNVTLLVLVPRIYIDSVEEPQIHLESETTFVESSSGQEVESVFDPDASKDEHVIEEVNDILRKNLTSEDFKKRSAYRDFGKFVLLAAMDNDFDRFQELLGGPEVSLETTWTELLELCEQSTHGYATVRLPRPTLPKLEPDVSSELVSADDDTKKSTTVAVVGTGDLFSSRISGELQVTTRPSDEEIKAGATTEPTTIVASSVAVLSDGRTIQFTFPSLAASNFVPKNHLPPELALRVHFYHQDGTPFIFSDPGAMESSVDYQTCVLRYVSEQPVNLPITLSVHAKVIDAKSDGTGSIIVDISGFPASGKVGSYFLAVEGADLESAGLLNTDGASFKSDPPSIDKNVGMIPISGNGVMSLSLKNLNPVANVTISATDSNGNKLESPIVLIVDRATNSSAGGTTTAPSK